jgi:hypothetical protein
MRICYLWSPSINDVVEAFFPDRDETYTALETDASQDLKNLETETFKFRFLAAIFFWNKTAPLCEE